MSVPCASHASLRQPGANARARGARSGHYHARKYDPSRLLGDAVVSFALSKQGSEVGDGECFSLADQALQNAGAKSAAAYTELTPDGDYVWGKPVRLADVRPGDILQFRGFTVRKVVTVTLQGQDGALQRTQSAETQERDHHTAIVQQNLGSSVVVLEQNIDPVGRVVQRNVVDITAHTETRTDPREATQTTTQIDVEGDVRAFRPQKAGPYRVADAAR